MTRWQLYLLLGSAFLLGILAVQLAPRFPDAIAQDEPDADTTGAEDPPMQPADLDADTAFDDVDVLDASGGRLVCRLFLLDVSTAAAIDTADRTTEVGQWVGEQVDQGMMLHGVDFEVGQKSTGYPQGYLNVCVYPG